MAAQPYRSHLTAEWREKGRERRISADDKVMCEANIERQLHRLPCSALEYYPKLKQSFPLGWSQELKSLFLGTRDKQSSFYALNGCGGQILSYVYDFLVVKYATHVKLTIPAACMGTFSDGIGVFHEGRALTYEVRDDLPKRSIAPQDYVSFASCGTIDFPTPRDRSVNMMPFIFGQKDSLPNNLLCYYDAIEACPYLMSERGKVGYLTVHESLVQANDSQHHQGLHIGAPGVILDQQTMTAFAAGHEHLPEHVRHFSDGDTFVGGIFFASSVDDTSVIYDALVDKAIPGIVDNHGGCESLRRLVGPGTKLSAGELVWMTDRTPHEALVQPTTGIRQYFRVVTSNVSHWVAEHSTPNPLVALPEHVVVVHENKFASGVTF
jgi:hypothetical protein